MKFKVLLLLILLIFQNSPVCGGQDKLEAALESYQHGVSAKTYIERKKFFNEAFTRYLESSEQLETAKLDYNIGNSFYQLEEYAWAILYYNRALKLEPQNQDTVSNLQMAQKQLGIEAQRVSFTFLERVLSFNGILLFSDRLEIFFLFGMITLIAASIYIWTRLPWIKTLALYSLIAFSVLLLNIVISRYGIPIEAIVVETTHLYRDAGWKYPVVVETPIWAGTKVQVINEQVNGKWLKVNTPDGMWGYIPYESSRII